MSLGPVAPVESERVWLRPGRAPLPLGLVAREEITASERPTAKVVSGRCGRDWSVFAKSRIVSQGGTESLTASDRAALSLRGLVIEFYGLPSGHSPVCSEVL